MFRIIGCTWVRIHNSSRFGTISTYGSYGYGPRYIWCTVTRPYVDTFRSFRDSYFACTEILLESWFTYSKIVLSCSITRPIIQDSNR
jgi:hypothetical protein